MRIVKHLAAAALLVTAALTSPGCQPKTAAKAPLRAALLPIAPPPAAPAAPIAAPAPPSVDPPLKLVAPDGTALTLVSLNGRAVIEDPLAFTELRLVFENPEDRIIEGTFTVRLPQGAALSRLAMKIGDAWQEGEIVERAAARAIYEDFLHRKEDPALLEKARGNELSARVFPIPARGRKEIILSYSEELSKNDAYALPLRGLPAVDEIDVAAFVRGAPSPAATLVKRALQPTADFTLDAEAIPRALGLRDKNLAVVRVTPASEPRPEPLAAALILVDTSASRALGFDDEARLVGDLARRVAASAGASAPLSVVAFDQAAEPIYDGEAGGFGDRQVAALIERGALGASNMEAALAFAAMRAKLRGLGRVIVLTDGIATAGSTDMRALRAQAAKLAGSGVERLDVIAIGGIRDDDGLKKLASAGLPREGVVTLASAGIDAITKRLESATLPKTPITIEGARSWWPREAEGMQPGDELRVFADIPEDAPAIKVSLGSAASRSDVILAVAPSPRPIPVLARAWAGAKIASLLDAEARLGSTPETQRAIVALSTANRVLSPYTSLLVLETEADYERYHIDRRALGSLLTIRDGDVALAERKTPPSPPDAGDAGEATDESASAALEEPAPEGRPPTWRRPEPTPSERSAASPASRGRAAGSAQGQTAARRAPRAPSIRMGATAVSGRLPPEVIRHIVHLNFGRFRSCYEDGLRARPKLAGRVVVRFVIDDEGAAREAKDDGSDLPDPKVIRCVIGVFSSLSFPPTDTGTITVIYPMVFSPITNEPSESAAEPRAPEASPTLPAPYVRPSYIPEPAPPEQRGELPFIDPYSGPFKQVMDALAGQGGAAAARATAKAWRARDPGDALALVALGEALEAAGDGAGAARAYGSLIDLFPARADMRRFAGERLERIAREAAQDLALDTYRTAAADRPDHPSSHRLLAMALLKRGAFEEAFKVTAAALRRGFSVARFGGADQILKEDLGLIAAAWIKADPGKRDALLERLRAEGARLEDEPSLRFVLVWETDANDVDFHIRDSSGGHAFFGNHKLPTGGELYADITTGYGPECFTVRTSLKGRPDAYTMEANYYARGPMGYGMGKLQIIDHDGSGGLHFEERPFVAMNDRASVNLGSYRGRPIYDAGAGGAGGAALTIK